VPRSATSIRKFQLRLFSEPDGDLIENWKPSSDDSDLEYSEGGDMVSFSFEIDNLGGTYTFATRAQNQDGWSEYGEETFTAAVRRGLRGGKPTRTVL